MENRIYADAFSIVGSLTDIKIDFSSINPQIDKNGQIIGESKTSEQLIILSLPLAKDLAKMLSAAVDNYEKRFGPVLNLEQYKHAPGQE